MSFLVLFLFEFSAIAQERGPQLGESWNHRQPEICLALEKKPPELPRELDRLDKARKSHLDYIHTLRLDQPTRQKLQDLGEIDLQLALREYGQAIKTGCGVLPSMEMGRAELNETERDTINQIIAISSARDRHTICRGSQTDKGKLNRILNTRITGKLSVAQRSEELISKVAVERGYATRYMLNSIPVENPPGQPREGRNFLTTAEKQKIEATLQQFFGVKTNTSKFVRVPGRDLHHQGNPLFDFQKTLWAWRKAVNPALLATSANELETSDLRESLCNSVPAAPAPLVAPAPVPAVRNKK